MLNKAPRKLQNVSSKRAQTYIYIYIYAFSRRFYPKRLTIAFRLYIFISMCVSWESNPQPFVLLTQCSTTEPHRNTDLYSPFMQFLQMQPFDCITTSLAAGSFPLTHALKHADKTQVEMFMCRCNWGKWAFFMSLSLNELPQWSSQLTASWRVRQNLILPSLTCSWINIFVDLGTTLWLTNQVWRTSLWLWSLGLQSVYISTLYACTSVSFIYHFLWF